MTHPPDKQHFRPIRLIEIELSQPVPALEQIDPITGRKYDRAMALVRLHAQLLGTIDLDLPAEGLPANIVIDAIWSELGTAIEAHLAEDGMLPITLPDVVGKGSDALPPSSHLMSIHPGTEEADHLRSALHGWDTIHPGTREADHLRSALPGWDTAAHCMRERAELLSRAPFVTITIPTRDRPDTLLACLRTLFALDYPNFEILVVDNAPQTNATAELVASLPSECIPIRYVRENRPGLSYAKNRGFEDAKGEIVAFTDDDVLVDSHWLAELVRGFSAARDVACVTGMIFPIELETAPQLWIEQFGGFSKGFARRVFDMKTHRPAGILYPYTAGMFGSGANMALHVPSVRRLRSVMRWGGPFDPALGAGGPAMGGEDLGLCFDIITSGHAIAYEPSAIVRHGHRRDYEGLQRQVYGYGVGLTAFVAKTIADRPLSLVTLLWKLPFGMAYALRSESGKNSKKRGDYPGELTGLERKGILYGPIAYVRARHRVRALAKQRVTHETVKPPAAAEVT